MYLAESTSAEWPETVMAVVFGFGFLVLLTVVAVVLTRAFVDYRKAKMTTDRERNLADLVTRFEGLAETTLDAQRRTATELAELRERITSVERILRSVD